MMTVVQKAFDGGGRRRQPGEIVDSTHWPLEQKLITQRYLRPASPDEVAAGQQKRQPQPAKAGVPARRASRA